MVRHDNYSHKLKSAKGTRFSRFSNVLAVCGLTICGVVGYVMVNSRSFIHNSEKYFSGKLQTEEERAKSFASLSGYTSSPRPSGLFEREGIKAKLEDAF